MNAADASKDADAEACQEVRSCHLSR